MYEEDAPEKVHLERGFPLGFAATPAAAAAKRYYIFNHIQFIIGYHQEASAAAASKRLDAGLDGSVEPAAEGEDITFRIVGFEVEPFTGMCACRMCVRGTITHTHTEREYTRA